MTGRNSDVPDLAGNLRRSVERFEVPRLRATVAMHEDTILAGARLLFPEEDWGPEPGGLDRQSYLDYLSAGYHEVATAIRDREVRRA